MMENKHRRQRAALDALLDAILDGQDDLIALKAPKRTTKTTSQRALRLGQINSFVETRGREPEPGSSDVHEAGLATSLAAMRALSCPSKRAEIESLDRHKLLQKPGSRDKNDEDATGETLADAAVPASLDDILEDPLFENPLARRPVDLPPELERFETRERRDPDEIAERRSCPTFPMWRPVFQRIREDLQARARRTLPTNATTRIAKGDIFIVDGHFQIVADVLSDAHDPARQRLRVVIDNATEYEPFLESFGKALWRDPAARRVSARDGQMASDGLFGSGIASLEASTPATEATPATGIALPTTSGCVYIARTLGPQPVGLAPRLLKIGCTTGDPTRRVAGAAKDTTFLRQPAQLVDVYRLRDINPHALEQALHAFFAEARVPMEIVDRFGEMREIREWFAVSRELIAETVQLVIERRLSAHRYDHEARKIDPA